jgi:hypothetical protein
MLSLPPFNDNVSDMGCAWTYFELADKRLDRGPIAFSENFDRTVMEVANVTGQAEAPGVTTYKIPKADTLH